MKPATAFLGLLLMVGASCKEDKADTRPPIPEGVGDSCLDDSGCDVGQVCVEEIRSGHQSLLIDTCQVSCESDHECDFAGTACHACETSVSAPFCDWYGCK